MTSLPKTVTRQRRGCDLNPGPSVPESCTLITRLPSHQTLRCGDRDSCSRFTFTYTVYITSIEHTNSDRRQWLKQIIGAMTRVLSGAGGLLTTTPRNALVLRGYDAILNCVTNLTSSTGENAILWSYDDDVISHVPCTSQHPGFVASPPDSATDCNIRALSSWQHGIGGVYRCQSGYGRASSALATVIVLGGLLYFH